MARASELINCLRFILNHPLTRSSKMTALGRYFSWQVGTRLIKQDVIVPYVDGTLLRARPGMTGATGNIYVGLHEFEDMAFLLHLLRKDDLFLDVGANVGSYTILAGGAVGARCMSFEPIKRTFGFLEDNINLNRLSARVEVLNIGIGKEKGSLRFTAELDTVNHVVSDAENGANTVEVPVRSLNELLKAKAPSLLKIDVEGFETNVIAGADEVLSCNSLMAVIMELNGSGNMYGFSESALHEKMLSFGFNTFKYLPFKRELVPLRGKPNKLGNTLYVKNVDVVKERLRTSQAYWIANASVSL